ncbi:uncharacterized protein LOC113217336 isoform X2 [Frankliniella occidentalis]|uniref:Uncharacterized protein LOC113217336 isoform X2 n=1 Tax=Frankliniella occidentalis TaxID=133901 RepID=A0A6J1TJQ9_FRAOC|nr:uncharacterized protein LOC113217336 isoform X2 [Frankliniella occidentalis]
MDCDMCFEEFDLVKRTPKVVPCGHTVCLQCLRRSTRKECPTCRTGFDASPASLPDNFAVLRLLEREAEDASSGGLCVRCSAVARDRCWSEHTVFIVEPALARYLEEAQERADRLEWPRLRVVEILDALIDDVRVRPPRDPRADAGRGAGRGHFKPEQIETALQDWRRHMFDVKWAAQPLWSLRPRPLWGEGRAPESRYGWPVYTDDGPPAPPVF